MKRHIPHSLCSAVLGVLGWVPWINHQYMSRPLSFFCEDAVLHILTEPLVSRAGATRSTCRIQSSPTLGARDEVSRRSAWRQLSHFCLHGSLVILLGWFWRAGIGRLSTAPHSRHWHRERQAVRGRGLEIFYPSTRFDLGVSQTKSGGFDLVSLLDNFRELVSLFPLWFPF